MHLAPLHPSAQESILVLGDAARGLANDVFQQQVLVRQQFKGYVNWFSEVVEHAA